ncbi:MAG: class I SAM-dependent methyltransferase [Epsilonproteobacteria bacterium]|nr:class I SAM-dependent methyltransferase [Campylobacterota bacterium]
MRQEIDLLKNYPKSKRDVTKRFETKSEQDRLKAREFGRDFFDGERSCGYGGYNYHPRFWENVVHDFVDFYGLKSGSRVLDVGCAKGFMLYDLKRLYPEIEVRGIDISEYAISHAKEEIKEYVQVGDARQLAFEDRSFDLVISITTLHNLERKDMKKALGEVMRVTKKDAFITLDAYRDEEEQRAMEAWNLTALTMMHTEEWKRFFDECGYSGDYYWFIP